MAWTPEAVSSDVNNPPLGEAVALLIRKEYVYYHLRHYLCSHVLAFPLADNHITQPALAIDSTNNGSNIFHRSTHASSRHCCKSLLDTVHLVHVRKSYPLTTPVSRHRLS